MAFSLLFFFFAFICSVCDWVKSSTCEAVCSAGDRWAPDVITRLQLFVDIIAKGQLRAAARPQSKEERGEFRSL